MILVSNKEYYTTTGIVIAIFYTFRPVCGRITEPRNKEVYNIATGTVLALLAEPLVGYTAAGKYRYKSCISCQEPAAVISQMPVSVHISDGVLELSAACNYYACVTECCSGRSKS